MYRLLAIAKYEERYVIPSAYVELGHQLEETACSLDFDGGPGMLDSGPFGEASGRPVPVSVETFHALRQRQTAPPHRSCPAPRQGQPAQLGRQGCAPGLFPEAARPGAERPAGATDPSKRDGTRDGTRDDREGSR